MRVPYTPLSEAQFLNILKHTDETTIRGNGLSDINIFKRTQIDRNLIHGDGFLSDIFSKLGPKIIPLLKNHVLPASKKFAKNVVGDILKGEKIKNLSKREG